MKETERKSTIQSIENYVSIIHDKGLDFDVPTHEEMVAMSGVELSRIFRQVRDLARTPST